MVINKNNGKILIEEYNECNGFIAGIKIILKNQIKYSKNYWNIRNKVL